MLISVLPAFFRSFVRSFIHSFSQSLLSHTILIAICIWNAFFLRRTQSTLFFFLLLKVHFLMEPFCVILQITMSVPHPLHQLLSYHCREVIVPNTIGTPKLVNNGQMMDQLFAFGHNGTDRLLKDAYPLSTWDITDFRRELKVCFHKAVSKRGEGRDRCVRTPFPHGPQRSA